MIYNEKEKPEEIEEISVVELIRYLRIKIDAKINIFKNQSRNGWLTSYM